MPTAGHPRLRIPTQDSGMISAFPVTILPQEQGFARMLFDLDFDEVPGLVRKRHGIVAFANSLGDTNEAKGAGLFFKDGVTPNYMAAYKNKVVASTGTTWSEVQPVGWTLDTGTFCDFTNQGSKVIVSDGKNTPFMWDGTTSTALTEMPKARYTCQHLTRIFGAGMDADPLVIRASHMGDPSVWDPFDLTHRAYQTYTGDDQKVTALVSLEDFVLIGKENALYALVGRATTDFSVHTIDRQVGIGSHWATKMVRGVAYFPDRNGNIYRMEPGTLPEKISAPINDIIKTVDPTHIEKARAFVLYDNQYVISLPTGAATRVTLAYDTLRGRWRQWSLGVGEAMPTPTTPGAIFTEVGGIQFYKFDESALIDKAANGIAARLETIEIHCGIPEHNKEFNNLWLGVWVAAADYDLSVDARLNMGDWTNLTPTAVTVSGNAGEYQRIRVPIGLTGRNIQFRIRNAVIDEDLRLLDAVLTFLPKELE